MQAKEFLLMTPTRKANPMEHRIARWLLAAFVLTLGWNFSAPAQAQDSRQLYEQGKLYYKQRLYHDAKKAFMKLIKTTQGQQSFNAHYYLARCYYKTGQIGSAITTLQIAKGLMKRNSHREAYKRFASKLLALYGKLTFVPEVDPDEVGRVKLKLVPKTAFSNKDKAAYFNGVMARIKRQGGLKLDNKPIFLPKGEYEISIERDQCLKLGFFEGEKVAGDLSIGDSPVSLSVKAKRSCNCPSNQKVFTEGKRQYCACAKGTGWNKEKQICEVVKQNNPWPWIITGIGVVVVGGTVAAVVAVTQNDGRRSFQFTAPGGGQVKLWK
ncbi:MAG: tetratricopeptide repeat protein [Deltaproteobacteria bacterium]|nr:MAG: tetratricopeptide repeat protein [Deltaproteobacteria bacterium]